MGAVLEAEEGPEAPRGVDVGEGKEEREKTLPLNMMGMVEVEGVVEEEEGVVAPAQS